MKIAEMIKLGVHGFKPSDIKQINGSGIATDEIISLAENGYSVSDVNELITLAQESGAVQPGNDEPKAAQEPAQLSGNEGEKAVYNNEEIKAKDAEIEKLKATLALVQNQNSTRNLGPTEPKDPRKEIQEIFKGIY